jgi:hypothetical protein
MTAFFIFDGERLVCERVYFDSMTMLKQIMGEVSWRKPATVLRALRMLAGLRKGLA